MSQNPIEIHDTDLIERPENLKPGSPPAPQSGGFMDQLKQFQQMLKLIPELKGMMKDLQGLGINLPGIMPGQGQNQATTGNIGAGSVQVNQFALLIKLLQNVYGDCTIDDLLTNLKRDFGNKKLSQLGGFLK